MNPATVNAVTRSIVALDVAAVDLGIVFPADGEAPGRGIWQRRDLTLEDILRLLPRCAAANSRGAHIFIRVRETPTGHPGVVLLDDVNARTISQLKSSGFAPSLIVETSPANFQAWIRLVERGSSVDRNVVQQAIRLLVRKFGADQRATSPVQPGRLPGFTNRKKKYLQPSGYYPFVRVLEAAPGVVAPGSAALLRDAARNLSNQTQFAQVVSPRHSQPTLAPEIGSRLDAIRCDAAKRIEDQVAAGQRSPAAGSASEVDFAAVVGALREGFETSELIAWLLNRRPDKAPAYAARTVQAAAEYVARKLRVSRNY